MSVDVPGLIARMTLEEKLAQLGSTWAFEILDGGRLDRDRARERLGPGSGRSPG